MHRVANQRGVNYENELNNVPPPRLLIAAFYVATAAICRHLSANGDDDSMASLPFREAIATNLPSPDVSTILCQQADWHAHCQPIKRFLCVAGRRPGIWNCGVNARRSGKPCVATHSIIESIQVQQFDPPTDATW